MSFFFGLIISSVDSFVNDSSIETLLSFFLLSYKSCSSNSIIISFLNAVKKVNRMSITMKNEKTVCDVFTLGTRKGHKNVTKKKESSNRLLRYMKQMNMSQPNFDLLLGRMILFTKRSLSVFFLLFTFWSSFFSAF